MLLGGFFNSKIQFSGSILNHINNIRANRTKGLFKGTVWRKRNFK